MDNLTGMAVFARVVEHESFTAAARELALSKSTVSKHVSRLEDRLGARLLNRTTRRLSLTEVGRVFYVRCRRIVEEAAEAEQEVTRLHAEPRGTLRLNVPHTFGTLHVAPALPQFMTRYPDICVDLDLDDRVVDMVEEGYDMAIRITRLPDSSLIARKLAPFRVAVCASPDYWRQHARPVRPEDLKQHNCLNYKYLLTGDAWPFHGPGGKQPVRVGGNLRANNGEALRSAALGGLGVFMAPTFIVGEDLQAGRLEEVLHELTEPGRDIYAVYPETRHLSAKVRAFIDFLVERFGPDPYWDRMGPMGSL